MKCMNCRYWDRGGYKNYLVGTCKNDKFVYTGDGEYETQVDGLGYWDSESYAAGFETGQDFGCIHFEKTEETK